MKPKNKTEKQVLELSNHLPALTEKQIQWNFTKALDYARKEFQGQRRKFVYRSTIVTTYKGWQVLRRIATIVTKGKRVERIEFIDEPAQHWLKGSDLVVFQRQKAMFWYNRYYEYCRDSVRSIRYWGIGKRNGCDMFSNYDADVYPIRKITEDFKHYPFLLWHVDSLDLIEMIRNKGKISKVETLYKIGKAGTDFFKCCKEDDFDELYNTFIIANRHHYKIKDMSDWVDYIGSLKKLGKDIRNPYYICPNDLHKAHQDALLKLDKIEFEEEGRKKVEQYEATYQKRVAKWINYHISKNGIEISVISSVADVWFEAKRMHHCVFKCEYYKKPTSLLLSAKDSQGNRLETIEYSLKDYRVLQSRGLQNHPTERHSDIVAMMNSAKSEIMRINTSKGALTA